MNYNNIISNKILNQKIWAISGGYGSFFHIHLGKMIPRNKEINNPLLKQELCGNIGEFIFDFYSDDWTITKNGKLYLSSYENDSEAIMPKLNELLCEYISKIHISKHNKLNMELSNDIIIEINCSLNDNYWDFTFGNQTLSFYENRVEVI